MSRFLFGVPLKAQSWGTLKKVSRENPCYLELSDLLTLCQYLVKVPKAQLCISRFFWANPYRDPPNPNLHPPPTPPFPSCQAETEPFAPNGRLRTRGKKRGIRAAKRPKGS